MEVAPQRDKRPILHSAAVITMLGGAICGGLALALKWRYLAVIGAVCVLGNVIGIAVQPESPKWLILKSRPQLAARSLRWIGILLSNCVLIT